MITCLMYGVIKWFINIMMHQLENSCMKNTSLA